MANKQFERLRPLIKDDGLERLKHSTVMVFGVGGVGGMAVEALARSGVGTLIIVDYDVVDETNINRQIIATYDTIGHAKVEVMKNRIKSINPACKVIAYPVLYSKETKAQFFAHDVDFVLDAIDMVTWKLDIIKTCLERNIPFITSTGQGNRLDPTKVTIKPLNQTTHDPLAKTLRVKLNKAHINTNFPVIFSEELPYKEPFQPNPYSSPFVPPAAGLTAASYIIKILTNKG
ncbi:MAG: tRNA threonylcarbamoyladenosine dehydratase [Bacillota bacterium]